MRVLVFHGYMLRGTGSNIYNANLTRALARWVSRVNRLPSAAYRMTSCAIF